MGVQTEARAHQPYGAALYPTVAAFAAAWGAARREDADELSPEERGGGMCLTPTVRLTQDQNEKK